MDIPYTGRAKKVGHYTWLSNH